MTFTRAYTRVTVCSPSRTAMLTGLRPERSRLWTIGPYWRNTTRAAGVPGTFVTLPEALKARGLNATGAGKVWHPGTSSGGDPSWGGGAVGGDDQPWSWSYSPVAGVDPRLLYWECDAWTNSTGQSSRSAGIPGGEGCVTSGACVACLERYNATLVHSWTHSPCDDLCYVDPMIAQYGAAALAERAAEPTRPFAFFAGFKRPHLGFQVPDRFLDLYPADVPLAAVRAPVPGFPPAGWSVNGEIRGYADVDPFVIPNKTFPGMLRDDKHAELRRAYYASVSLMDDNLGKLLDALEASGLRNNTWITFTGDHGWQLGEHGNWAKVTLEENVARVPLIVVPPTGPAGAGFLRNVTIGAADGAFVSLLDLYPTLAELLNLTAVPAGQLDGASLVPLLRGQAPGGRHAAAFTQITRQEPNCADPDTLGLPPTLAADSDPARGGGGSAAAAAAAAAVTAAPNCTMGLSVRVLNWRYVAWVSFDYGAAETNGVGVGPRWSEAGSIRGEELYSHADDDAGDGRRNNDFDASENSNVAADPAFASVKAGLLALLQKEFPEGGR